MQFFFSLLDRFLLFSSTCLDPLFQVSCLFFCSLSDIFRIVLFAFQKVLLSFLFHPICFLMAARSPKNICFSFGVNALLSSSVEAHSVRVRVTAAAGPATLRSLAVFKCTDPANALLV